MHGPSHVAGCAHEALVAGWCVGRVHGQRNAMSESRWKQVVGFARGIQEEAWFVGKMGAWYGHMVLALPWWS